VELTVVVDRIDGDQAVLEVHGQMVNWPLSALPEGTTEGAIVCLELSSTPADASAAEARLERLRQRSTTSDIIDL